MEEFNVGELHFLQAAQRQAVTRNIREIRESKNTLYIGKRVHELHEMLAPFGYFMQALRSTGLVQRTAYGYMYGYQNAVAELPAAAVQAMMNHKLVINANRGRKFGEWTELLKKMPPPKEGPPTMYERWIAELIANKPKRLTGHLANRVKRDPEELLEEVRAVYSRAYKRLLGDDRVRERFVKACVSSLYQQFNVASKKFAPEKAERSA